MKSIDVDIYLIYSKILGHIRFMLSFFYFSFLRNEIYFYFQNRRLDMSICNIWPERREAAYLFITRYRDVWRGRRRDNQ